MADKKITDLPVLPVGSIIPATDVIPVVNGGITKQVTLANAVTATFNAGSVGVGSVNTRTGAVVLTSTDVGLANVNNTSDVNKPVSTAQQAALDLKANLASPTFTGTVGGITKTMVGLGSVDNTADVSKPVSTAQQTAINAVSPGRLLGVQIFTASGTYTPTAGTNSVVVEVQAPGGGSGGADALVVNASQNSSWGNGGGGGGYGLKRITASFSGVTVTIGAVGAAGTAGPNAGGTGGTTSFGALLSCTGGAGGTAAAAASGNARSPVGTQASGGTATSADVSRPGEDGGLALLVAAQTPSIGRGGTSMFGPPVGITIGLNSIAAIAGHGFGGGASGPINTGTAAVAATAGAAGAPGIVIVWEYA